MSTPTTTTSPPQPTGSSNPVSIKFWWQVICNWINLLSPDGATAYDTGWVNLTLTNGWAAVGTNTPAYRRIGRTVFLRGRVSGGAASSIAATLPADARPGTLSNAMVREGGGTGYTLMLINTSGAITFSSTSSAPNMDTTFAVA